MVQYQPPSAFDPTQDVFQASQAWPAQYARQQAPLLPSRFETFRIPRERGVVGFRLTFEDFRGGLNKQVGAFERYASRLSASTLESRFQEVLCLPQLKTLQNNTLPATAYYGMACNIFGTFVMGETDELTAHNPSLWVENTTTDPTLEAINWTPAGAVSCLHPIVIGGYGKQRLCVGNFSAGAQILSTLATGGPTVDGQMVAATAGLYGLIQTTINTDTILLYAGTGGSAALLSTPASAAIGAGVSTVLANVPAGGYALGLLSLSGGPLRCWWVWPPGTTSGTATVATTGLEVLSRVMSTNQEGTDPQELKFPLKGVIYAQIYRDGIVASDQERIVWQNGRQIRDLRIFADRTPNSDFTFRVAGMTVNGPELLVAVNMVPSLNSGQTTTTSWVEAYDFDLDSWHTVTDQGYSAVSTIAGGNLDINMIGPEGMGFSKATRFMHRLLGTATNSLTGWQRHYGPPYGTNPFTLRQTSGAGASSGREFANTGDAFSPLFWLPPPLKGAPLSVKRIICMGDVDAGGAVGSAANVIVTCGGQQATFVPGHSTYPQLFPVEDDLAPFGLLQLHVKLNRTTATTRMTPQALPIIVEGYAAIRDLPDPPMPYFDLED